MKVASFCSKPKPVVLCVDDEENALNVRRLVLESAGFTVCTAATASEAMNIVRAQALDLVLTDYYLDGVTGGELARAVKETDPHLKVAIYSGAIDLPYDARHADAILPKTEGVTALIDGVRGVLQRKRNAA